VQVPAFPESVFSAYWRLASTVQPTLRRWSIRKNKPQSARERIVVWDETLEHVGPAGDFLFFFLA
jgi:hypothetical protein